MNRQQSMGASLNDLLRFNNGIYNRFTWYYGNNKWISDIKQSGDKVEIEFVDTRDIRKVLTLDGKTRVRNYES